MRDNTDYMIGGAWARHPSDTMHMLVADTWAGDIPVDQLAKLTLHFVVQRGDTRKYTVDTCCLPRCHGGSNAQDMLEILADYLENELAQLPWFRNCTIRRVEKLKMWPYGYLEYRSEVRKESYILCAYNGAFHVQKRFSLQLLGCTRKVTFGALWVDCCNLLHSNIPHKVFGAADVMSDRAAVMRLSMPYLELLLPRAPHSRLRLRSFGIRYNSIQGLHKDATVREQLRRLLSAGTAHVLESTRHAVTGSLTNIEAANAQEHGIEHYFSTLKKPYRGSPSVRDCVQGTARAVMHQMQSLRGVTAEHLQGVVQTPHSREPLTPEEVLKCGSRACAAAIQFWAFICVDESVDEVYYTFNKWFQAKGRAFFGAAVSEEGGEDFLDSAFEDPVAGHTEVCEALEVPHEADCRLVQSVADRASEDADVPAGESPDTQPVPAEHAAAEAKDPDLEALFGPPEPDFSEQQPLTLIQVMQQALASKSPAFKLDGDAEEGRGERACLERARQMVTPIRHFIRFTRCEEALLSVATIEDCLASALGRAGLSGVAMRCNSPHHLPWRRSAAAQRIRTSKPMPGSLPSGNARLIHLVKLRLDEARGELTASCADEIFMTQPCSGTVFGELAAERVKATSLRIHVVLTKASEEAMQLLLKEQETLPQLPPEDGAAADAEEEEAVQSEAFGGAATVAMEHFTDRSFTRNVYEQSLAKYFAGLHWLYKSAGHPFVDEQGMVALAKPQPWDLQLRIPSYFMRLCGDLKGHRFSKSIYNLVLPLMPVKGASVKFTWVPNPEPS
eukprot:s1297_g3.t1